MTKGALAQALDDRCARWASHPPSNVERAVVDILRNSRDAEAQWHKATRRARGIHSRSAPPTAVDLLDLAIGSAILAVGYEVMKELPDKVLDEYDALEKAARLLLRFYLGRANATQSQLKELGWDGLTTHNSRWAYALMDIEEDLTVYQHYDHRDLCFLPRLDLREKQEMRPRCFEAYFSSFLDRQHGCWRYEFTIWLSGHLFPNLPEGSEAKLRGHLKGHGKNAMDAYLRGGLVKRRKGWRQAGVVPAAEGLPVGTPGPLERPMSELLGNTAAEQRHWLRQGWGVSGLPSCDP